jgi:hypothetical protein
MELMSITFLSFIERERRDWGGIKRHYIGGGGGENKIFCLEGSQAVPASPSGKGKAYDQN